MNRDLFIRQTSRREMLRAASLLAGGSAIAGLLPGALRAVPQGGAASTDPVEQMKAQMASVPVQTLKLRDHIYMLYGPGGNMVALDGPEGKVLVDASFSTVAPKVKQILDGFSNARFRLLINTHWHFDHTDGNAAMHQMGATILAHENTLKRLSTKQYMAFLNLNFPPAPPDALPRQTFTDNHTLHTNGEEIALTHVAPAHTDSDIHVHYRNSNVLHMGDTWFNGSYPFFDSSTGGRIDGMIAAVTTGLKLADGSTKIVPGHGPAGDKAALTKDYNMLVAVRDRVSKQKAAGKTLEEVIAATPTSEFDARYGGGFIKPEQFVTLVYTTL